MNKKLLNILTKIPIEWISVILISIIVGFFSSKAGVFTLFGLAILIILFIWLRQLWWWITNTGDYTITKLVIHKNKRKPFKLFNGFHPIIIRKNKTFSIIKNFMFDKSTNYHFNDNDQHDVNKLFGFSIGFHHNNSFRFGWRPNKDLTKIEIVGYEYCNKKRIPTKPICEIDFNKWYRFELIYVSSLNQIQYLVFDENKNVKRLCSPIILNKNIFWGYTLTLYFGGNKKAPHKMIIFKSK